MAMDEVDNVTCRFLVNRSKKYSPIVLIVGEQQEGKSTVAWYLANKIMQMKNKVQNPTFDEWDYKKYCCQNLDDVKKVIDESDNQVIVIEEAGWQLSSKQWQSKENTVFDQIIQTQAYKHNIYFIILPQAPQLAKAHRRMINLVLWVVKKYVDKRMVVVYPNFIRRHYWNLEDIDWTNWFPFKTRIKYNAVIMEKAKEYTDKYLVDFKKIIMDDITGRKSKGFKLLRCHTCGSKRIAETEGGFWFCKTCFDVYVLGK